MTTSIRTWKGTRSIRVNGSHMALRLRFETLLRKHNTALDALTNEKLSRLDDQILHERHTGLLESVIPEGFYPDEPFIARLILLLRERESLRADITRLEAYTIRLNAEIGRLDTQNELLKRSVRTYKTACLDREVDQRGLPGCLEAL